ncbi:MAG: nuclear transport factor 2 family protein [Planctomycetota bacterium]
MSFLQRLFFESPLWMGVFSFLLFAIVLFARRRMSGRASRLALPVVLLCIVMLFAVQGLVETEREAIYQVLDSFVKAIAEENLAGIAETIGRGYESETLDRDDIVQFIASRLDSLDIYDTRLRRRDVTIQGNRAKMVLGAIATVRVGSGAGMYHTGRWRIGWARESGEWRIVSLRPEMIDTMAFDSLRRLGASIP